MIRPMKWLWPSSVAGRIAVILIGALLVIHTVAFALFARDRWVETTRVFAQSVVTRMTAIVDLVEAAPAEDRSDLLQAVNSPTLWVTWTAEPPMPSDHDVPFEETVREYLQPLSDRPIRIDIPEHWQDWHDRDGPELGPPPDLQPSRRKLLISIGQPDGGSRLQQGAPAPEGVIEADPVGRALAPQQVQAPRGDGHRRLSD